MSLSNPLMLAQLVLLLLACAPMNGQQPTSSRQTERVTVSADIEEGQTKGWNPYGAGVSVVKLHGGHALQTQGDCQVFSGRAGDQASMFRDVSIEGDVSVERDDVSSGFLVRASMQSRGSESGGYYACIRKLAAGYAIVQLYRFPEFVLLQEARIKGTVEANRPVHLKVMCQGPNLWVWAGLMRI